MVTAEAVWTRAPPRLHSPLTPSLLHFQLSALHFRLKFILVYTLSYWRKVTSTVIYLSTIMCLILVVSYIQFRFVVYLYNFWLCTTKRSSAPLNTDVKMSPPNEAAPFGA